MKNTALWFLAVVQEPSLGLYYVQNHFKESLDRTNAAKVKKEEQVKLVRINFANFEEEQKNQLNLVSNCFF